MVTLQDNSNLCHTNCLLILSFPVGFPGRVFELRWEIIDYNRVRKMKKTLCRK